jgi:hypothetical protein
LALIVDALSSVNARKEVKRSFIVSSMIVCVAVCDLLSTKEIWLDEICKIRMPGSFERSKIESGRRDSQSP